VRGLLSWSQQQHVEQQMPAQMVLPTGTKAAIDYSQEQPTVSVRIQEVRSARGCVRLL
jgi:hypothetical protein